MLETIGYIKELYFLSPHPVSFSLIESKTSGTFYKQQLDLQCSSLSLGAKLNYIFNTCAVAVFREKICI